MRLDKGRLRIISRTSRALVWLILLPPVILGIGWFVSQDPGSPGEVGLGQFLFNGFAVLLILLAIAGMAGDLVFYVGCRIWCPGIRQFLGDRAISSTNSEVIARQSWQRSGDPELDSYIEEFARLTALRAVLTGFLMFAAVVVAIILFATREP